MATPLPPTRLLLRLSSLVLLASFLVSLPVAAQDADLPNSSTEPGHSTDSPEPGDGVQSHNVELLAGWAYPDLGSQSPHLSSGASLGLEANGARLDVLDAPEMLILDTDGRSGHFAIRSRNAGTWSDWVAVEAQPEEGPDGSSEDPGAIGPIWIGEDSEQVEIVDLEGSIGSLRVETLASQSQVPLELVTSAVIGQPAIQPRSAWTSNGWAFANDGCSNGPYYSDNVRAMVIHHTVTTNSYSQSQVDDILRGIYRTHVIINGWCDVGYNFVIDRFGTIWEARSGGIDKPVIGGHAKGFNTWSSGVALLGQHQYRASPAAAAPSAASLASISALASWKLGLHGIDPLGTTWMKSRTGATSGLRYPNGTWVEVPTVLGHRDLGFTSCPGSYTYSRIASVRLGTSRDTAVPATAVAYEPQLSGPAFLTLNTDGAIRAGGAAEYPSSAPNPIDVSSPAALAIDAVDSRGFVLYDNGRLQGFGGAHAPSAKPAGAQAAVDLVISADGTAGYVLDSSGELHPFNGAPNLSASPVNGALTTAAAVDIAANGRGYIVDIAGRLQPVGGAPAQTIGQVVDAVDVGVWSDGQSGWVLDATGLLHSFGDAQDQIRSGSSWNGEAQALMVDPNGNGGWILDSEGRIDVFGNERVAAPLSTTVGSRVATDTAIWWELRPELADKDMAKYASALVELFLGTQLDLSELDRYTWKADFQGSSSLAEELANSNAWAGKIVETNYVGVLGRPPEAVGRDYWVDRLRNGLRTQDLGALFYSSPEYVAAAGSHEAYVRRLYQALLHREADGPGLQHWIENLSTGRAQPIDIATGFYGSIESRNDRVAALYETILGRGPEDDGLAYWSERLLTQDDIDLAIDLATSDEFYGLATD